MPRGCTVGRGQCQLCSAGDRNSDLASIGKNFEDKQTGKSLPPNRQIFAHAYKQSDVDVASAQGVGLDDVAPRLHFIAHEHGEHAVRFDGVVNLHTQ